MLTDSQRDIIKATVPLLETGGEALTKHFYTILLADHPELRPRFCARAYCLFARFALPAIPARGAVGLRWGGPRG